MPRKLTGNKRISGAVFHIADDEHPAEVFISPLLNEARYMYTVTFKRTGHRFGGEYEGVRGFSPISGAAALSLYDARRLDEIKWITRGS